MNTEQENNLMKTASRNNSWVWLDPAVKVHLIAFLSDIRGKYFTDADGVTMPNYPAFFADILQAHNALYEYSIPCRALLDKKTLEEHQRAVKAIRDFDRYLAQDGDLHFVLRGWGAENHPAYEGGKGICIESIRVRKGTRGATWDTRELYYLPELLGFVDLSSIVTDITKEHPRYKRIRTALREELAKGWTGSGNATWMAPVRTLAERCKELDATLGMYLPDATNMERANIILRLFGLDGSPIDSKEFAKILSKR